MYISTLAMFLLLPDRVQGVVELIERRKEKRKGFK